MQAQLDKEQLLGHLQGEEERKIGGHVLDLARLAWETNKPPQVTDFYDPYQRRVARSVLGGAARGGRAAAGRLQTGGKSTVGHLSPQFYVLEAIKSPLRVLQAEGNFAFQRAEHRDYLGSLLATGLERDKIGDIIVLPAGCQVVVAAEIGDYLLSNWTRVHQVGGIQVSEIYEEQLNVEPERTKEIKTTVASLRLDAIAAGGLRHFPLQMAREIKLIR